MASFRFHPPSIARTDELVWLLRAAFAERLPEPLEDHRDRAVLDLADRLALTAPIGGRSRTTHGRTWLSEALAGHFRQAHAHSAIRAVVHERTALQIAEIALRRSIPVVFLKGFALFLCGRDRSGGRPIGDLDILVPEASAGELHAELRRNGFQAEGEAGNEHHLAALVSPAGGGVDIHFCLRDLFLDETNWATWKTLEQHGALVGVERYPDNCAIPTIEFQAAHILVHGLAHHAWRPHTYPMLQMVGDLNELLPDPSAWGDLLDSLRAILLRSIRGPELDAVRNLALGLKAGQVPDLESNQASREALLLRHILAGYLEPAYARRLRLRHTFVRLRDAARQGRLRTYLARKLRRLQIE